ncbi:DNA topoisomerase (ATP-hydrolyzing) subunit A [Trueperella sp. LYQ143]|uniref:DNA gyrase/topoisomerase IV subunit A n=1 Tax=Trueperella sp. LYQ143 TaxID=3391059 RepID=UPI00398321DF
MAKTTEHIVDIDVSQEMRTSFLEYSYSVIYARALPDARDGLKPVQRRILYQMDRMGLRPDRAHVKSSRVVGEVMGRLHPHGDVAIYDAMVRLAQPFTMRLPLVDGHGNFGSLDDGPAAPRYTEARLAPAAIAMTASLDEDVVTMLPNYDGSDTQPEVLPAAIPNLLVNGTSGIAVGMATNMAPHNLNEVIAGAQHLLMHPEASLDELMRFIPGPDLPEGGKIVGLDGVRQAYETGRGIFRTRATAHIENISARKKGIIFTELPYLVGVEKVIEKIKDGVQSKKLQGISGVQNLTDRKHGTRLVVEVKNSFNPEAVLAALYQNTPLEESFGINNVALVDGQPRTLGLKQLLEVFLHHRVDVTRRRTQFRLAKAKDRLHLVDGLLMILVDIDEAIAVIRSSDDSAMACDRLMKVFDLSEVQAEYILQLRLRRLTKFSQLELEAERDQLRDTIAELTEILESERALHQLVSDELGQVAQEFGTPRRTVLLEAEAAAPTGAEKPLRVADDPCWVILSADGRIARIVGENPPSRSGPRSTHDTVAGLVYTTNRSHVGLLCSDGSLQRLSVLDIPAIPDTEAAPSLSAGAQANELILMGKGTRIISLVDLTSDASPLAIATAQGKIKRVKPDYPDKGSIDLITLLDDDVVIGAHPATDNDQIVLVTSNAQLLRFDADAVRPQGRSGQGIVGIRLSPDAQVIAMGVVPRDDLAAHGVVTIAGTSTSLPGTMPGSAKVTPLDRYPAKGRGTGGVRTQRFVRGEDILQQAWVGPLPPRASGPHGKPVPLPEIDERRDASGSVLTHVVSAIG